MAFMTAAKPAAAIMMKPTRAIRRMPWVNTSSCSAQLITPLSEITAKPIRPPNTIEPLHSCTPRASNRARAIRPSWRALSGVLLALRCSPATASSA
ncbi:hypothetical protein D3C84_1100870 [compost metagenome]